MIILRLFYKPGTFAKGKVCDSRANVILMRSLKSPFLILLVIAIPVIGYLAMHLFSHVLPLYGNHGGMQIFYTVVIIALGLSIPYWMLKLSLKKAHMGDAREKDISLSDIPKDKAEISHNSHK